MKKFKTFKKKTWTDYYVYFRQEGSSLCNTSEEITQQTHQGPQICLFAKAIQFQTFQQEWQTTGNRNIYLLNKKYNFQKQFWTQEKSFQLNKLNHSRVQLNHSRVSTTSLKSFSQLIEEFQLNHLRISTESIKSFHWI